MLTSCGLLYYQAGRNKVTRLLFIAQSAPALAGPALTLALAEIQRSTLDVVLYEEAFHMYRQTMSALESGENTSPVAAAWYESVKGKQVPLDRAWIEHARKEGQSTMDKLEVELKGYSTNLIKESIRVNFGVRVKPPAPGANRAPFNADGPP